MSANPTPDMGRVYELTSGDFRLAVTTDFGPRVLFGSIAGSANIFAVLDEFELPGIDTGWQLRGGHRLWHAPEVYPRTYAADNQPVQVITAGDGSVEFISPMEELTGLVKSISIKPLGENMFALTHRIENAGQWDVELALWALSVMAPGGRAVFPFARDPEGNPYAVDRSLNLWPYSEFTDPRLTVGTEYITLDQDPNASEACKIGINCAEAWCAYVNHGVALVKKTDYEPELVYPDNGCNIESYSCDRFLEIETLGPLSLLEPGDEAVHVEIWQGLADVGSVAGEDEIAANLAARLD